MSRSRLTSFLAAGLLGVAAAHAHAGDGDFDFTEADFFAPMPTVLSASRLVQPINEVPVAITVIDRELIEASSAVNVAELLRLVPGFQVTYTEGIDAITTYQGFADQFPRRMQVLVDGRPVYNPGISGVIWSALPLTLDEIERIEVVRGANAAAYGSNAFLGTINIITRSPESVDSAMFRGMVGSAKTREGELALSGRADQFAFGVTASYAGNSGFPDKFDDSTSRLFNFRGVYHAAARDTWSFNAGVRETPFHSEAFRIPRNRLFRSSYQQLIWEHAISDDQDVRVQAFHNAFQSPDDVTFVDPGSGFPLNIDYSLSTHRYDIEVQHRWSPAEGWRVSWGAGLRRDQASGAGVFDTADEIQRDMARLFANVEWHATPDLAVNAGLMGETFDAFGEYLSPRVALNWQLMTNQTLRVSAARAYRMPTVLEQHGELKVDILLTPASPDAIELLGTADNKPEDVNSYELGYMIELPSVDGNIDLRLFRHEVDHVLYSFRDAGLPGAPLRFDDAGAVSTGGVELQARLRPSTDSLIHLAYAYARAQGGYLFRIDAFGNPTPSSRGNPRPAKESVPEHTLTLLGSRRFGDGWQVSGTWNYVSRMEWLGEGFHVDQQSRVDARLSKRLRQENGDIELSLNVQNIFDDPYWEFTPTTGSDVNGNLAERRIYAQVKVSLR